MARALAHVDLEGMAAAPQGIERLSPLSFEHVTLMGRYRFNPIDFAAHGKLRPLPEVVRFENQQLSA
jgi:hypothetical protein